MKDKYPSLKDRLRALFALSVKAQDDEEKACPAVEELAALIDGNVTPERREELLLHLDQCPDCYHEWLDAAAIIKTNEREDTTGRMPQTKKKRFGAFNIRYFLAAAMAASLIFLAYYQMPGFVMFGRPSAATIIERQYQSVIHNQDAGKEMADNPLNRIFKKPETVDQRYGFTGTSTEKTTDPAREFVAGFQTGFTVLSTGENLPGTMAGKDKTYLRIGRWYALLSYVCGTSGSLSENFRKVQHDAVALLIKDLKQREKNENEAVILARSLARIDSEMAQNKKDVCGFLTSELNFICEGMNVTGNH